MTTRKLGLTLATAFFFMAAPKLYARTPQQEPHAAAASLQFASALGSTLHPGDSLRAFSAAPDSASTLRSLQAPQVPINAAASKFVAEYIRKNELVLQQVEERSEPVFKIMEPILAKYNLPLELKYLAVVESDLIRTAVSRVGAAGPWQLMPVTARELGLKVTKKTDERKHYSKSTTAAAKYLRDLYTVYGDWLLVIAAYNAGPGNIDKAIRRAGSRNFWKLQYFLPAETRGHVKRFIGTHYFFEDCGSETTLTKAENATYAKALAQFAAQQLVETALPPASDDCAPVNAVPPPLVATTQQK